MLAGSHQGLVCVSIRAAQLPPPCCILLCAAACWKGVLPPFIFHGAPRLVCALSVFKPCRFGTCCDLSAEEECLIPLYPSDIIQ